MITTFLSLSGADAKFVEGVHSHLPDGIAYYYPRSFTNGENLIEAMEERVGKATVFAFFASEASAKSHWVNFELDRARIRLITDKHFKLFVFPIDRKVTREMLPSWMTEFWIPNAGQNQRDIARYLRNAVAFQEILNSPTGRGYGRGALSDVAMQSFTDNVVANGASPNVLIFAGVKPWEMSPTLSTMPSIISDEKAPGAMTLTLMLNFAHSTANASVIRMTAALLIELRAAPLPP